MKMKIKSPDTPVAIFKVDRTKLIPCYIPEFEGEFFAIHCLFSLLMSNIDLNKEDIFCTRQLAAELTFLDNDSVEYGRQYTETQLAEYCHRARLLGLLDYEYLGEDDDDYGHYIKFSESPTNRKEVRHA